MINPKHLILALALTSAGAPILHADTFSDLVDQIVAGNPSIEAQRQRANATIEGMKADNILADPEVEFERLWRHGEGENRWSAGVRQSFEWPGAYNARRKAIAITSQAQAAQLESDIIACRTQAAQLLIELAAANKEISTLADIHSAMETLQEKYLLAWKHGETTIIDVNKIKIETIRSATRLEEAEAARRAIEAELYALAGKDSQNLSLSNELDFPYLTLHSLGEYTTAAQTSPRMQALTLMAEAAEKQNSVTKASRWPGFTLGYHHAFEDGAHFNGLSLGMSLPIYSRKNRVKSAESEAMAARFDIVSQRIQLETQIQSDYITAESLHKQIEAYAPIVDGVNNLQLLRKALDGGELSLLSYLQEVNYFIEARLDYITLSKEYALLLTQLNSNLAAK